MKEGKFLEAESLDEFKELYLKFHKQDLMLNEGFSYFDVTTSNMDGTFIGESFDNKIRVHFLHEHNKQYLEQVNEEELMEQARKEVAEDIAKYIEKHPEYVKPEKKD